MRHKPQNKGKHRRKHIKTIDWKPEKMKHEGHWKVAFSETSFCCIVRFSSWSRSHCNSCLYLRWFVSIKMTKKPNFLKWPQWDLCAWRTQENRWNQQCLSLCLTALPSLFPWAGTGGTGTSSSVLGIWALYQDTHTRTQKLSGCITKLWTSLDCFS